MFSKRLAAGIVLLVFSVLMIGCCTEEECKSEYGLIKTDQECYDVYGVNWGPGSGDTPIIILEPNSSAATLQLRPKDQPPYSEGGSIFDADGNCFLREDFIGYKTMTFEYLTKGDSDWANAINISKGIVHAKKDGIILELKRNGNYGLHWTIKEDGAGGRTCTATATDEYDDGEIPSEIYDLLQEDLHLQTESNADIPAEQLRFLVIF